MLNLKANYDGKNWLKFAICAASVLIVYGAFIVFSVEYVIYPTLQVVNHFSDELEDDNVANWFKVNLQVIFIQHFDSNINQFVIWAAILGFSLAAGIFYVVMQVSTLVFVLPIKILKRCNLTPSEHLTITRNGKVWFTTASKPKKVKDAKNEGP